MNKVWNNIKQNIGTVVLCFSCSPILCSCAKLATPRHPLLEEPGTLSFSYGGAIAPKAHFTVVYTLDFSSMEMNVKVSKGQDVDPKVLLRPWDKGRVPVPQSVSLAKEKPPQLVHLAQKIFSTAKSCKGSELTIGVIGQTLSILPSKKTNSSSILSIFNGGCYGNSDDDFVATDEQAFLDLVSDIVALRTK